MHPAGRRRRPVSRTAADRLRGSGRLRDPRRRRRGVTPGAKSPKWQLRRPPRTPVSRDIGPKRRQTGVFRLKPARTGASNPSRRGKARARAREGPVAQANAPVSSADLFAQKASVVGGIKRRTALSVLAGPPRVDGTVHDPSSQSQLGLLRCARVIRARKRAHPGHEPVILLIIPLCLAC